MIIFEDCICHSPGHIDYGTFLARETVSAGRLSARARSDVESCVSKTTSVQDLHTSKADAGHHTVARGAFIYFVADSKS